MEEKQGLKTTEPKGTAGNAEADAKLRQAANHFANDEDTLEGFESIDMSTMSIPFIRVLQKLSPQLNKNKPEYIPGAEEGQFFNTLTKEVYGSSMEIVVLRFDHVYIEWKPDRGGFAGAHDPANAERLAVKKTFGAWETKDGNSLQENYVYLLLIVGREKDGPVVYSMFSSGIKVAKELNRLMLTHLLEDGTRAKPYYLVWNLSTEYAENNQGSWYKPKIKFSRLVDEPILLAAREERKLLPQRKVDYAQIEDQHEGQYEGDF